MRPSADSLDLTPDERFREVARILAVGVLRLRSRTVLPADFGEHCDSENCAVHSRDSLEFSVTPRLSVHGG